MLKGGRSMRLNWRELMIIAVQPAKFFSKEGPLYMKIVPSGWRKKGEIYSERWCRLRGNLLFYFKGRDLLSEPQGVVVLEQCFIKEEYGEIQSFAFCVEYIGEEHNQFFAAHSAELRDEWVALLQSASYENLRSQLQSLRLQLMARTGQDPIDEERHGVMGQTDPGDSVSEPILEMSVSCTDLPKNSFGEAPSTFVSVSCVTPPDTRWSKSGQTEIISRSCSPFFLTTISFETTRNISVITRLRANVYEVQDRNMHTERRIFKVSPIGQVICSFRDIVTSPDNKLVRDIIGADGTPIGGKITVLLWELDDAEDKPQAVIKRDNPSNHVYPSHAPKSGYSASATSRYPNGGMMRNRAHSLARSAYLKSLCCNPCNKTYRFPNSDGTSMVQVQETMMESRLNFYIPQQIIKIYLQEEKRKLEELNMFEELSHEWERVRSAVMTEHVTMIARYNESLEFLSKQTKGPQFKKSTAKSDKLLEFVPINLHLQRLRVEESGCRESLYDMITVGAPAAHSLKFRHGGLKRMLQHYTEEQSRSTKNLSLQAAKTLSQISDLKNSIDWLASDVLSAARHVSLESMRNKTAALNEKVTELLNVINENFMEEAFNSYRNASFRGSPVKTPHGSSSGGSSSANSNDKSTTKGSSSPCDSGNSSSRTSGISDELQLTLHSNRFSSASSMGSTSNHQHQQHSQVSSSSCSSRSPYEDWEWDGMSFVKSPGANIVGCSGGVTSCETNSRCGGGKMLSSWTSMMIKNLSEYMNVIRQVVEILPHTASPKERVGAVESSIKHLKECISQVQEQAKYSIAFLRMQEEHSNLSFLQSLQCRRDIVFSQALTALVTGMMIKFRENIFNKVFMSQMSSLGILAHFEGLISTHGDEMGMLEDFAVGIHDLGGVTFKIVKTSTTDADTMPVLTGTRSSVVVIIPVLPSMTDAIPEELLSGQPIKVYPALFNIGVNEEQTMAEIFGDTSLQDTINQDSLQKLDNYYSRLVHMIPQKDWRETRSSVSLDVLMSSLRHHISTKKNKNVEILHISSQLARRLDGIRFTSCKSAKDRTAMSVTLEECMILQDEHQLHSQMFTHLLDTMRSEGTRRDNTRKNVGSPKYAFNKMQLRAFPKLYRPPEGTYGKTVAT
ncbi:type I inositol 3,4-bisphosphate 4-phosphatase-like isoform X2 [Acanthaster planci]|uniref:phosphatidylinositol-3,4-bisphosphate 4-phosphatase n=1 Tax=Acanthaster planci TaxID=133434 RepID=A0A8B7ZRM6_ACAPL|nr:type I inositol 3,4-bisphosphate 4-phosphatase-like isoform X2 [Acanthaster planci]